MWDDIAELVRYRIIEIMGKETILVMRLINKRTCEMVEDVLRWYDNENWELLQEIRLYMRGEKDYCWLSGGSMKIGGGTSIWLHIVYRADIFKNYDRLGIIMNQYGLYYKFDDLELCWYDGVYAVAIKKVDDKEIIFEFTFLVSGCKKMIFKPMIGNRFDMGLDEDVFELKW